MKNSILLSTACNKAIKNRPQKTWAGLANAHLLLRRYITQTRSICESDRVKKFQALSRY